MSQASQLQQRLWRWHFYAGLIVCPAAILLAITGAIYLFKPQINSAIDTRIEASAPAVIPSSTALPADALLEKLLAQTAPSQLKRYILPSAEGRSVKLEIIQADGTTKLYWLDKYSGEILHSQAHNAQFLHVVKKLHSELLLGNTGSYVVELMASWFIILVISGIYLWLKHPSNDTPKKLLNPALPAKSSRARTIR